MCDTFRFYLLFFKGALDLMVITNSLKNTTFRGLLVQFSSKPKGRQSKLTCGLLRLYLIQSILTFYLGRASKLTYNFKFLTVNARNPALCPGNPI